MKPIVVLKNWLASRARKVPATTIVLHATGGESASGAISWLRKIGLSYHYVIAKDGQITKCVGISRIAFHAGVSDGPAGKYVNNYSIGISMANRNDGVDPYPQAQVAACVDLCKELVAALPSLKWLTCHYSIAPTRKTDPKGFPSRMVADACGLTPWKVKL